jgi:ketosteroid isomerase-like protein
MNTQELESLIAKFGKAYFNADREGLRACTTPDFEWHQHSGPNAPEGLILKGIDAVCDEIERRKREWRNVKYEKFQNHFSPAFITSTFLVSGIDESGRPFHVRAVDLYSVKGGKIALKDSYWKQILVR